MLWEGFKRLHEAKGVVDLIGAELPSPLALLNLSMNDLAALGLSEGFCRSLAGPVGETFVNLRALREEEPEVVGIGAGREVREKSVDRLPDRRSIPTSKAVSTARRDW
jgi:hypothetical protein